MIEESTSPWSSLIVVVPKPDSTLRLSNDFKKLNSDFNRYQSGLPDQPTGEGPVHFNTGPDQRLLAGAPDTRSNLQNSLQHLSGL